MNKTVYVLVAPSGFVTLAKGRSSRPRRWSPSWFVSTVGGVPLEVVRRYVENHKQAA